MSGTERLARASFVRQSTKNGNLQFQHKMCPCLSTCLSSPML